MWESCSTTVLNDLLMRPITAIVGLNAPANSRSAFVRGMPPKPKQSGFSLWIGNLPDEVSIFDLKDYFARGASDQIESVFLIFRSNCAFVNYKTKLACLEALARFRDGTFPGARIALRSRRTSSSMNIDTISTQMNYEGRDAINAGSIDSSGAHLMPMGPRSVASGGVRDRFFILKSLTIDDLELSTFNGIWATQAHNEVILNDAYKVGSFLMSLGCRHAKDYNPSQRKMYILSSRQIVLETSSATLEWHQDYKMEQHLALRSCQTARTERTKSTE